GEIPQDQIRDQLFELRDLADEARSQLGALRSLNGQSPSQRLVPAPSGPLIPLPVPSATYDDWAICCSGGGVRSAAYCLGALQSLDLSGLLPKVKWILGVSGGSYIAASRALVAHDLAEAPGGLDPYAQTSAPRPRLPAYAPGTPEEHTLRYNSRY